ncbi:MAG: AbrB/MazE/SpoVT family DNA-binding domain-containing protein [Methanobrevibacter sp.]|nr:AbrB/MazE/SpoVT family DNA-binding domain-containing protein [Methanobrevibacter sp.]
MTIETTVYNGNQTTIPSKIRKKHNIKPKDIVEWKENKEGKIEVSFRKKISFKDIKGKVKLDQKTNSVDLKKELYK